MTIALVDWIAHRSVVSRLSHGFTGCFCNGHRIVGIRRVGPYCMVAQPTGRPLNVLNRERNLPVAVQLNSISESARTGHLGWARHTRCPIRGNAFHVPDPPRVSKHLQVKPMALILSVYLCLASYRPFPVVRQVIYLALNRLCQSVGPRE